MSDSYKLKSISTQQETPEIPMIHQSRQRPAPFRLHPFLSRKAAPDQGQGPTPSSPLVL